MLLNKGKCKSLPLLKVQKHPVVNIWSFRSQNAFFKALCSLMDKLPNKEKCKPLPQFKMLNTPRCQFWVILRSFRRQV